MNFTNNIEILFFWQENVKIAGSKHNIIIDTTA